MLNMLRRVTSEGTCDLDPPNQQILKIFLFRDYQPKNGCGPENWSKTSTYGTKITPIG